MNRIIYGLKLSKKCRAGRANSQDRREKAGRPDCPVCPLTACSCSVFIVLSIVTTIVTTIVLLNNHSDCELWSCEIWVMLETGCPCMSHKLSPTGLETGNYSLCPAVSSLTSLFLNSLVRAEKCLYNCRDAAAAWQQYISKLTCFYSDSQFTTLCRQTLTLLLDLRQSV